MKEVSVNEEPQDANTEEEEAAINKHSDML